MSSQVLESSTDVCSSDQNLNSPVPLNSSCAASSFSPATMMGYSTLQKSIDDSSAPVGLASKEYSKSSKDNEIASHLPSSHDVSSVAFAVEELYSPHPQDKAHHLCGAQKQKDIKELHSIVPMDLYCNSLDNSAVEVGQSVNNIALPNSMMSLMNAASASGIEYNLIPSFDSSLPNVNNITQLGLSNLFHPSETDSEVALTLASLGDPKNDKLDHSCSLHETFSLAGRDNSSAPADPNQNTMSLTSASTEQGNLLDISNGRGLVEKDFATTDPGERSNGADLHNMCVPDKVTHNEPTLVLRSRRARGNSAQPQRHHNFPDPERIGRRRRKKDSKNKGSLDASVDHTGLSSVLRKSEINSTNSQVTSSIHIKDSSHQDANNIFVNQDQLSESKNSRNFLNPPDKLYLLEKEFVFSESQLPVLEEHTDQKRPTTFSKRSSCDDIAYLQRASISPSKLQAPGTSGSIHAAQLNNFTHSSFSTLPDSNVMAPKLITEQALNQPGDEMVQNQSQCSSGLYSLAEGANTAQVGASPVLFSPPCNRSLPQSAQAAPVCNSTLSSNFVTPQTVSISATQCISHASNLTSMSSPGKNCHGLNTSSGGPVKMGNDNFYALPTSTLTFQDQNYFQSSGSMLPMSTGTQSLSNCTISFLPVSQASSSFPNPVYHPNTSTVPSVPVAPHGLHNTYISCSEPAHQSYDTPTFTKNFDKSNSIPSDGGGDLVNSSAEQNSSDTGGLSTVLLLPVSAAAAEKENLLGQLLKASEHCEPASLIPAGVVNDVIPAVGYRILEVSNLSEMIRSMHSCSSSNIAGSIVIQEQASLREGAVSQLSVICTACQEGTVCATSNRIACGDVIPDTTSVPAWDINVRVRQLVQEFGLSEEQVQRMLEILGIFYRPCDSPSVSTSSFLYPTSSMASGHAGSAVTQRPNSSSRTANPTTNISAHSDQLANGSCPRTANQTTNSSAHSERLGNGVALPGASNVKQTEADATMKKSFNNKTVGLKFESLENLSVSGGSSTPYVKTCNTTDAAGAKKRKRAKQTTPPLPKPKTISCTECSAMFASLNHLKKHSLSHNLAQHTCPYCHSYFKKPYNLREHIKKHQNVKYKCNICDREFTDRSSLIVHHKSSHERKKEFQCTECSRTFYRRIHFTDHMRMHTRERPYACEVCNKRFIWRDSVKKHMETHIAAAKYSCRLCGKWFRWLQGIRQHLQQQHKLKKSDVEAQVLNGTSALFQKHTQVQLLQSAQVKQGLPQPSTDSQLPSQSGMTTVGHGSQNGPQTSMLLPNFKPESVAVAPAADGFPKPVSVEPFHTEDQDEVKRAVRSIQLSETYSKSMSPKKVERCSSASNPLASSSSFDGRDASLELGCKGIFLVENGLPSSAGNAEVVQVQTLPQVQNHLVEQDRQSEAGSSQCNPQPCAQSINKSMDAFHHDPTSSSTVTGEWRPRYLASSSVSLNANSSVSSNQNAEDYDMTASSCEPKDISTTCNVLFNSDAKATGSVEPSQSVHDYISDELRSSTNAS
ncbi:Zinc finger C2H2-type [Trinorchestia longiramus]|nr:Zinc finger C2H2-type [Trinorchestia longiramus]